MRAILASVRCAGKENRLRLTAACVSLIVLMFCGFEKKQLQKALSGFVGEPTKCFPRSEDIWNDCSEITTVDVFFYCLVFSLSTANCLLMITS